MSFIERFFLLCPLFGVSFIGGSTVIASLTDYSYTVEPRYNELQETIKIVHTNRIFIFHPNSS